MKFGRYENPESNLYIEFIKLGRDEVYYRWGVIGFESDGEGYLTDKEAEDVVRENRRSGFLFVHESPLSEGGVKKTSSVLDWIAGVTRK